MLDYNTRKQLEETYLIEMAISRNDAVQLCGQISFQFKVHLAKCFLFYDTMWYDHWLTECGNFCIRCDNIRLKPKAKRPESIFFKEYFIDELETADDAKHFLNSAIMSCSGMDRDEATNIEAETFVLLYNELIDILAEHLAEEETFDRSVYKEIINDIINKHI